MADTFKTTLYFESGKFGWTETYFRQADNEAPVIFRAGKLCAARGGLVGPNASLLKFVVRNTVNKMVFGPFDVGKLDTNNPNIGTSDRPYSAVMLRLFNDANRRPGLKYLRGWPDSSIVQNPIVYPNGIDFAGLAVVRDAYTAELTQNNWGYLAKLLVGVGAPTYVNITRVAFTRATRRATGRPFDLPVGRQRAKGAG